MKQLNISIKPSRVLLIKKIIIGLIATFLFVHLTSAAPVNQGRIHIQQKTFALEGDSVFIEIEIGLNDAQVNSKSFVLLTPVLRAGSVSKDLASIQINGRNKHKAYKRLVSLGKGNPDAATVIDASNRKAPQVHTYKTSFRYEPWMEKAEFLLREDQCECSGPIIPMSFELLAKNLTNRNIPQVNPKYQPKLVATFVVPEAETVKKRSETGKAYLDFPVNTSVIRPEFRNNATELQRMYELINLVKNDPDATITGITITGYASPEGRYNTNMELSGSRARALAGHLKKIYGFGEKLLKMEAKGEDWQTLEQLVVQSDIPEREQALAIIRSTDIFDGREKKLMNLAGSAPYRSMMKNMFPKLRRSDYELSYTVLPFTIEKGKEVMKTRPSGLSLNELFLIANTYEPGSDAFNEVFETAARIFPQSDVANLNAAANALNRKDTLSAEKYLSKIKTQDAAYWNNSGVLAGLKEEYGKAAEYFAKSHAAGNKEASNNITEIEKAEN